MLTPKLVQVEVALQDSPQQMYELIENTLKSWGDPLRWAVMAVDLQHQTARVEAIVCIHDLKVQPSSPVPSPGDSHA